MRISPETVWLYACFTTSTPLRSDPQKDTSSPRLSPLPLRSPSNSASRMVPSGRRIRTVLTVIFLSGRLERPIKPITSNIGRKTSKKGKKIQPSAICDQSAPSLTSCVVGGKATVPSKSARRDGIGGDGAANMAEAGTGTGYPVAPVAGPGVP